MKALIFNSGTGTRMGNLTADRPKCLVQLINGETILSRQLRILKKCGITEVVITTGKYTAEIAKEAAKFSSIKADIIENPQYAETNYIYSMYLAADAINGDILMLHGDLVFEEAVVRKILEAPENNCCIVDMSADLPEKDFKGRIENGRIKDISVNIAGDDCCTLQPIYKLSADTISQWLSNVKKFIETGETSCYAEKALIPLLDEIKLYPVDCAGSFINEIDTEEDHRRVSSEIFFRDKGIATQIEQLPEIIRSTGAERPFAVIGRHCLNSMIPFIPENTCIFTEYRENPDEESILKAAEIFKSNKCDLLISVGGGSVIDTAKTVKVFCDTNVKHIAVPTTAGSGSEATQFSVYYKNGEKQGFDDPGILSDIVIADSRMLHTLSRSQRTDTLLDALCHSIESILSLRATEESRSYAECSLKLIETCYLPYICGDNSCCSIAMAASNLAGNAINISRTSAGHALSYVLTSKYGVKHGRAAAVCLRNTLIHLQRTDRFPKNIEKYFGLLENIISLDKNERLTAERPFSTELASHVNSDRMKNFTVALTETDISDIYELIIKEIF